MRVRDMIAFRVVRRRRLIAALAVTGCLTSGAGLAWAATAPASTDSNVTGPLVVRDASGKLALSVQLVPGGDHPVGSYELNVTDLGSYTGTIPVTASPAGSGSAPTVYHLSGTTSSSFVGQSDIATPSSVQVRMEGTVKPASDFGDVNIWVGKSLPMSGDPGGCPSAVSAAPNAGTTPTPGASCAGGVTKYHLVTFAASAASGALAAKAVMKAMTSGDSNALWSLLSPEVQQGLGDASALGPLFASGQGWTLVSYSLINPGSTGFDSGYEYYAQAVEARVQDPSGAASSEYSVLLFVYEDGAWKLIGAESGT